MDVSTGSYGVNLRSRYRLIGSIENNQFAHSSSPFLFRVIIRPLHGLYRRVHAKETIADRSTETIGPI